MQADIAVLKKGQESLTAKVADLQQMGEETLEIVQGFASHLDGETERLRVEARQSEHRIMDHVDRRVAAAVEEVVSPMRKIDTKDTALVTQLEEKSVISPKESAKITALSPFPAV